MPPGRRIADRLPTVSVDKLATAAMRTHGHHFIESSAMVFHFFGISYSLDHLDSKRARCAELLAEECGSSTRLDTQGGTV